MKNFMWLKFVLLSAVLCSQSNFIDAEVTGQTSSVADAVDKGNGNDKGMGEKVQEQLLTAFDSVKKSIEEFASKINTDEIVQGMQNFTSMLESYAKKTADQLTAASASIGGGNAEEKKE